MTRIEDISEFLDDLDRNGLTIAPKDEVFPKKPAKKSEAPEEPEEEPDDVDETPDVLDPVVAAAPVDDENLPERVVWSMAYNSIDVINTAVYEPETGIYWLNDNIFKEGEIAFIGLRRGSEFGCNLDVDYPGGAQFTPIPLPVDCEVFFDPARYDYDGKYHAPGLADEECRRREPYPDERDLITALELATKYPTPGFFVFCRGGRFEVICTSHHNHRDQDTDILICIFNAKSCTDGYRKAWSDILAQADSVMIGTEIRYSPCEHWIWPDAIIEDMVDEAESGDPHQCWSGDDEDD